MRTSGRSSVSTCMKWRPTSGVRTRWVSVLQLSALAHSSVIQSGAMAVSIRSRSSTASVASRRSAQTTSRGTQGARPFTFLVALEALGVVAFQELWCELKDLEGG